MDAVTGDEQVGLDTTRRRIPCSIDELAPSPSRCLPEAD